MTKYTKELMDLLKTNFIKVAGTRKFQNTSETREYYLDVLDDNLYEPMNDAANIAYGEGSGDEIGSGKMNALRSSSALTYNLFTNDLAKITKSVRRIGNGNYFVNFEDKEYTLKPNVSSAKANLDAFLFCEDTCEAVAIEMKMMEWIFNKPGNLKDKYLKPENYIDSEAGKVFVEVAKELIGSADYEDSSIAKKEYPCSLARYDAFQMFKHAVACYTKCFKNSKIKKLTLVNCVWTLPDPQLLLEKHRERYISDEASELAEFETFKSIMAPVIKRFAKIGVDFKICFYTFREFLDIMDKDQNHMDYLRRYTFE